MRKCKTQVGMPASILLLKYIFLLQCALQFMKGILHSVYIFWLNAQCLETTAHKKPEVVRRGILFSYAHFAASETYSNVNINFRINTKFCEEHSYQQILTQLCFLLLDEEKFMWMIFTLHLRNILNLQLNYYATSLVIIFCHCLPCTRPGGRKVGRTDCRATGAW